MDNREILENFMESNCREVNEKDMDRYISMLDAGSTLDDLLPELELLNPSLDLLLKRKSDIEEELEENTTGYSEEDLNKSLKRVTELIEYYTVKKKKKKTLVVVRPSTPIATTITRQLRNIDDSDEIIEKKETVLTKVPKKDINVVDLKGFPKGSCDRPYTGSDKVFKLQSMKYLLVYKAKIKEKELTEFLEEKSGIKELDTTYHLLPFIHTRVLVQFQNTIKSSDQGYFDIVIGDKACRPDIFKIGKITVDLVACQNWVLLGNTDKKSKTYKDRLNAIWNCSTRGEAMEKYATFDGAAVKVGQIYDMHHRSKVIEEEIDIAKVCTYSWHKELHAKLLAEFWNHRRLMWIVDGGGGVLKTTYIKAFVKKYGGIILTSASHDKDIATLIAEAVSRGEKTEYIFIDLPRATRGHKMYAAIECLLNGIVTALKWHGITLSIGLTRVVVFSNWNPPFNPRRIKEDIESKKTRIKESLEITTDHMMRTLANSLKIDVKDLTKEQKKKVSKEALEEVEYLIDLAESSEQSQIKMSNEDSISNDRWNICDIVKKNIKCDDTDCDICAETKGKCKEDKIAVWRENPFYDEKFDKQVPKEYRFKDDFDNIDMAYRARLKLKEESKKAK